MLYINFFLCTAGFQTKTTEVTLQPQDSAAVQAAVKAITDEQRTKAQSKTLISAIVTCIFACVFGGIATLSCAVPALICAVAVSYSEVNGVLKMGMHCCVTARAHRKRGHATHSTAK